MALESGTKCKTCFVCLRMVRSYVVPEKVFFWKLEFGSGWPPSLVWLFNAFFSATFPKMMYMLTDHICVFLFIFTINNIVDCPLGIPTQRCGEHLLLLRKVVHADEQVIWYLYLYLERGHDVHADEQYRGHGAQCWISFFVMIFT